MRSLRRFLTLILVCVPLSVHGVTRLDHKKLSVSYSYFRLPNATEPARPYFRQPNSTEPPALRSIATFSVDYDSFEFFEVALEKLETFLEMVKEIGFEHKDESRLDTLYLHGGAINTRSPVPIDPARSPRASYLPDQYGLYVMNLVGYEKKEWGQTLNDMGVIHCHEVYPGGSIVGATPEIARRVNELPWVQFMEPYHPFLKPRPGPTDPTLLFLSVEFGRLPGKESAQERVRALATGPDVSIRGSSVYGTFTFAAVPSILAEPTVLGAYPPGGIIISAPPPGGPPVPVPTLHPIVLCTLAGALVLVAYLSLWRRP